MTFTKKSDILFEVMRVETQTHIRNQGVAIAEVRGALQILAADQPCWQRKHPRTA